jgi:hypothetical protein
MAVSGISDATGEGRKAARRLDVAHVERTAAVWQSAFGLGSGLAVSVPVASASPSDNAFAALAKQHQNGDTNTFVAGRKVALSKSILRFVCSVEGKAHNSP